MLYMYGKTARCKALSSLLQTLLFLMYTGRISVVRIMFYMYWVLCVKMIKYDHKMLSKELLEIRNELTKLSLDFDCVNVISLFIILLLCINI